MKSYFITIEKCSHCPNRKFVLDKKLSCSSLKNNPPAQYVFDSEDDMFEHCELEELDTFFDSILEEEREKSKKLYDVWCDSREEIQSLQQQVKEYEARMNKAADWCIAGVKFAAIEALLRQGLAKYIGDK